MNQWQLNSYGNVCSEVSGANPGELDGRMVYYLVRPQQDGSFNYDFALAFPFENGKNGRQYIPYNTWQRSMNFADNNNLVANWIQVTNQGQNSQAGALVFYDYSGAEVKRDFMRIPAGGRRDVGAHDLGINVIGLVEWIPQNASTPFTVKNVRYYYDNPSGENSFSTAYVVGGGRGVGVESVIPIDNFERSTAIDISNALNENVTANLAIYNQTGELVVSFKQELSPHASWRVVADAHLYRQKGIAVISGSRKGSLVTTAMNMDWHEDARLMNIYGLRSKPAVGSVLRGSYNTFLNQRCQLLLSNPTSQDAGASVTMTRYDGTVVLNAKRLYVPARGMLDFDLCSNDIDDVYGVVSIQSDIPNSLAAEVIRIGQHDQYRFPTPVRQ
jgi:hypothetical protein